MWELVNARCSGVTRCVSSSAKGQWALHLEVQLCVMCVSWSTAALWSDLAFQGGFCRPRRWPKANLLAKLGEVMATFSDESGLEKKCFLLQKKTSNHHQTPQLVHCFYRFLSLLVDVSTAIKKKLWWEHVARRFLTGQGRSYCVCPFLMKRRSDLRPCLFFSQNCAVGSWGSSSLWSVPPAVPGYCQAVVLRAWRLGLLLQSCLWDALAWK